MYSPWDKNEEGHIQVCWTTPESFEGVCHTAIQDVAGKAGGTSHTHHHIIIYKLLHRGG